MRHPSNLMWWAALPIMLTALFTEPAHACGGCFSSSAAAGPGAVLQSAERVLFARDPLTKTSLAWIEIRYTGLAQDFAWVIPLPAAPKVGVGTSFAFNRLDLATAPRFKRTFTGKLENCRKKPKPGGPDAGSEPEMVYTDSGGGGCGGDSFDSAYGSSFTDPGSGGGQGAGLQTLDSDAGDDLDVGIEVVEQDQAGPYDYVLIDAKDPDALIKWLETNGYAVPAKAKPIVAAHVAKGDIFLAVKLAAGTTTNEIRPITLEMPDTEACVPLRLTSIAATEDLSVVAYLAGPGRAVPKNHLHVVLNPMRINLAGGGNNYANVLSAALDEAGGRAFVTEYAGSLGQVSVPGEYGLQRALQRDAVHDEGAPIQPQRLATQPFEEDTNAAGLVATLKNSAFPITRDTVALLDQYSGIVAMAESANSMGQAMNPVWVFSRLASGQLVAGVTGLNKVAVDGKGLAAALHKGFSGPLLRLHEVMSANPTLSRLAMRISPEEMTRDPIFAYNPALPDAGAIHYVSLTGVCSQGWWPADKTRMDVSGGGVSGSWLMSGAPPQVPNNATDPRFVSAPAAMRIELLDETGPAVNIHSTQLALVDTAIGGAVPGKPALPGDMQLKPAAARWTPPKSDPPVTVVGDTSKFGGWSPRGPARVLLLVCLGGLMLVSRRRRQS